MQDMQEAVRLGVDAVGFVCVPKSKRFIEPAQAAALTNALPAFVSSVALLSDADAEMLEAVINALRPELLQFHGDESSAQCEAAGLPYFKALSAKSGEVLQAQISHYPSARAILLDSHDPGGLGGTGSTFDWGVIPDDSRDRLILAGGLSAANVGEAIRIVRPYAVDVSSGIESAPGVKDPALMRAFIDAVRAADAALSNQ